MAGEIPDKKQTAYDTSKPFNIDRMCHEFLKIEITFEK